MFKSLPFPLHGTVCGQRIEMHQSEKGNFNCLFPERSASAELLLCDWSIFSHDHGSFLLKKLTETFSKFVDNFTIMFACVSNP